MIITLIGSLRDEGAWHAMSMELTMGGHAVISVSVFPSTMGGKREWYTPFEKTILDLVHLQKIVLGDAVMLVTPNYIGQSTARELLWAKIMEKPVYTSVAGLESGDYLPGDVIDAMAERVLDPDRNNE